MSNLLKASLCAAVLAAGLSAPAAAQWGHW